MSKSYLDTDALRRCRLKMLEIRYFEEYVQRYFQRGHVPGTTHLYIGQEAVATGVEVALKPDDFVASTYRGHGHALARGVGHGELAAEMLGKETGVCGGRAGSMNVIDFSHNLVGSFGIVGGSIAAATGVGLSQRGTGNVVVAYFGDGATNQGYFHECLNFMKVFELPVVLVCENNGYGEFTPWRDVTAGGDLVERAKVFGIPTRQADGMDVSEVARVIAPLVEAARSGGGPQFIECTTYRFVGHSRSDPGAYRPPGELDEWKKRDPLLVVANRLTEEFGLSAEDLEADSQQMLGEIEQAFTAALEAPFPDPETKIGAYVGE